MNDEEFVNWLVKRLVNHYGESKDADFVIRLKGMAERIQDMENKIEQMGYDIAEANNRN